MDEFNRVVILSHGLIGRLPEAAIQSVMTELVDRGSLLIGQMNIQPKADWHPDLQRQFLLLISKAANFQGYELANVLRTVQALRDADSPAPQAIWTGPQNGTFPVRYLEQVLYDLISTASERILLVTFAATRVKKLVACLREAINRGVLVHLVLETEEDSSGQLSFDAAKAFPEDVRSKCKIVAWPHDKRPRNKAGRPAKLHAKCAVIDGATVISSANFTDDALVRNMELGILLRDGDFSNEIYGHFMSLINTGELSPR